MSQSYNTCFKEPDGTDVSQEFVEKKYLLDVYPNLIDPAKAPALWLWGCGVAGRLGNDSIVNQSSPVQTVSGGTNWKQVSASFWSLGGVNSGIKTDGTLWLWGDGGSGRLGTNSTTNQSSPVQTVSGGTNWKQVDSGGPHSAAIKTDGSLWLWGCGGNGRLGTNSTTNQSSPVQTVSGGNNWKQVSAAVATTAAIKTDGSLWLWGCGGGGALGDNSITDRSSPVQTISGGTNWKQVATSGKFNAARHNTAAIKTDGSLWLWGSGQRGQLGNNSTTYQSSPVQTVSGGTNWKQVALSQYNAAAIKTDGTLWLWGSGFSGVLGDNYTTSQSSPVQTVSGGTNWKCVSLGYKNISAAIKTDGSLWLWGSGNEFGVVLINCCTVSRSSPTQIISESNNWKELSLGGSNIMTIREEGDW